MRRRWSNPVIPGQAHAGHMSGMDKEKQKMEKDEQNQDRAVLLGAPPKKQPKEGRNSVPTLSP